ncbi:hypothetical protein AWB77_01849 [Caballeronia fortuita]|uniref:DUF3022 domain-containing protein n=1 Tax=Caballeronia fortuita TaxID=1777138 RepID=A0A158AJW8_9BURK|nr:hypothetical protein [Caballeronia fortuita]SAK58211.1 hypothetical protein AWB77_01849 [Caballeronia fortuita]
MKVTDQDQRVDELQQALSRAFVAPKTPTMGVVDEGDDVVFNVSWVVETGRDTTLDSRCSATVRLAALQFERYGAMDTAQRLIVQDRFTAAVQEAFTRSRLGQLDPDACSLDIRAADIWFDVPETL